jgi:hypothetical protein
LGQREGRQIGLRYRPGACLQYQYVKVNAELIVGILLLAEVAELLVEVLAHTDVGEHAVKLVGELVAARIPQTVDHVLLGVHAERDRVDEPLGQHLPVELVKEVLVVQVLEDGDAAEQLLVDFVLVDISG